MRCVERTESSDGATIFRAVDRKRVLSEVRDWAERQKRSHSEILRIGAFGSYARGDVAPGSDVDLLVLVTDSDEPRWYMRATAFDTSILTVPADVFVYTEAECERMAQSNCWMRHVLSEIIWV